jgi:hypothetical protein
LGGSLGSIWDPARAHPVNIIIIIIIIPQDSWEPPEAFALGDFIYLNPPLIEIALRNNLRIKLFTEEGLRRK